MQEKTTIPVDTGSGYKYTYVYCSVNVLDLYFVVLEALKLHHFQFAFMSDIGTNLRRLMARFGLTVSQVTEKTGLDRRTIKSMLSETNRPQARTLYRLAQGLGVSADELFQEPSLLTHSVFDRETNPVVQRVIATHPQLFRGWTEADFDELYSRFGTGGEMSIPGTIESAKSMNTKREVLKKVAVLLEGSESFLLSGFVDLLYERSVLIEDKN